MLIPVADVSGNQHDTWNIVDFSYTQHFRNLPMEMVSLQGLPHRALNSQYDSSQSRVTSFLHFRWWAYPYHSATIQIRVPTPRTRAKTWPPMIDVSHLTKTYGNVQAVKNISFKVNAREVVGFLGPNGAGKSTSLRIIAGFLGATRGRVVIDGIDTTEDPVRARSKIGYMPESVPLYPEMRVSEYLRFRAELKCVPRKQRADAVMLAMRAVRLDDHGQVIIGNLSRGYRQRVGLADALVSRPPVLILDEPTAGLDPNQIREVRDLIRSLANQHTVLLSTHIMSEVEATCDRALVIDHGRLVAQGPLEDLRKLRRSSVTRFAVRMNTARVLDGSDVIDIIELLEKVQGAREALEIGRKRDAVVLEVRWTPTTDQANGTEQAVRVLVSAGVLVREVTPLKTSLEDVFALLTEEDYSTDDEAARENDTSAESEPSNQSDLSNQGEAAL